MAENKIWDRIGKGFLIAYGGVFVYAMVGHALNELGNIRIPPYNFLYKNSAQEIHKSGALEDTTNTLSSSNSLENTVLPAKAKVDGTKVIE